MVWTLDSYDGVSTGCTETQHCTYHLLRDHDDGLDGELPVAVVEQVL